MPVELQAWPLAEIHIFADVNVEELLGRPILD